MRIESKQRQTRPGWKGIGHYLLGLLVGTLPLLAGALAGVLVFAILLPLGYTSLATSIYSWLPPAAFLVLWIGDLVLGIVRWRKSFSFSLGVFTLLLLLLLASPGLVLAWALGSDGLAR